MFSAMVSWEDYGWWGAFLGVGFGIVVVVGGEVCSARVAWLFVRDRRAMILRHFTSTSCAQEYFRHFDLL